MKILFIALSAVFLAGCVSYRETYTADGNMVYAISCKLQQVDACFEKAGDICGRLGYHQVAADGGPPPEEPPKPAAEPQSAFGMGNIADRIGLERKIYVKCGR